MSEEQTTWKIDTRDASFEADVFERSRLGLVVIDFWADWCAPCRTLGPVLEKLVQEYQGQWTLVKADTESSGEAASRFGVSGIPAVYAVLNGEVIDAFQGALPESAIRQWLDPLLAKARVVEACSLIGEHPARAENLLREVLADSPNEYAAAIALAQLLLDSDREPECRDLLEGLAARGFLEPEAERIRAALELRSNSGADVDAARLAAQAAPADFAAQLRLAEALAGSQQYEAAFEICLKLVAEDRRQTGERAKELMVDVFRVLPDDSELTSDYRRKLSMLLY